MLKNIGIAVALLLLLFVFNRITNGVFTSRRNLTNLFRQAAVLMVIASGLMMLLVERNFDLSAGAGVYLVTVIISLLTVRHGFNPWVATIIAMVCGILIGSLNGFFIGYIGVPAFIATLAGQLIFRGSGYVLTNAATIGPMPDNFIKLSQGFIPPGITAIIIIVILALFVFFSVRNYGKMRQWYGGLRSWCSGW